MYSKFDLEIIHNGYNKKYKIIEPSKELQIACNNLKGLSNLEVYLKKATINESFKESENFMKRHFNIHSIPHRTQEEVAEYLYRISSYRPSKSIREYSNYAKSKLIDPYDLPKKVMNEDYRYGELEVSIIGSSHKRIIAKTPTIFLAIKISELATSITTGIITHEIAHSQINSHKGALKSYYNGEVVSIFLEFLQYSEKNETEMEIEKIFRLSEIVTIVEVLINYNQGIEDLSNDELHEYHKYLESNLKAIMLFEIYQNSNNSVKNNILASIQKIFDGEKTVENLLSDYNITLNESTSFLKQNVKEYKKCFQI